MRRGLLVSLVAILVIGLGLLAATIVSGNTPHLGLDLQGGASVVLQPKTKAKSSDLKTSIEIIRNRVDALGVAEPDITQQGNNIVIELPGVKNQQRALQLVGRTAQLLFRPVLNQLPYNQPTAPGQPPPTITTPDQDDPNATVILPDKDKRITYQLGPSELTGKALASADAVIDQTGQWKVDFTTTSKGSGQWDAVAQRNYQKQVAIDLDGVVQSAPQINAQQFNGRGEISGNFTQQEAKDLALVLKYGALPVQLQPQTVETVSATLGKDSLSAGLIAGAVGIALVALYMVLYYRALGLVVWLGLALSGALLYSIITWLGQTQGLALSLAGVTGIIVSVGVTVDSYIVYFERLKDEIRSGKTIRSSVDRGFKRAYRTILAADLVSIFAAGTLYLLSVGAVRGFAFFLGLSTLLDLITAYFYTRPMVVLLGRSRFFTEARWVGVARGLAAPGPGAVVEAAI
ncbi:MAG: protein translocase subunit SecD [Acidimicrobiia bacterium]|nr:protein translocase subunit SecD [Acidimicrobiia bacterium]